MNERYVIACGPKKMVDKIYKTRGWAERELKRRQSNALKFCGSMQQYASWDVCTLEMLRLRDYPIVKQNPFTGKTVTVMASIEGSFLDPTTETYMSA